MNREDAEVAKNRREGAMTTGSRTTLLLLSFTACCVSCHSGSEPPHKSNATEPLTRTRDATAAMRHVFRGLAMFQADATRICEASATGIDPSDREQLRRLIDTYETKVNVAISQISGEGPELLNQAGQMSSEFAETRDRWMAKNPAVESAINQADAVLETILDALGGDRDRLTAATARAGLHDDKRQQAAQVVQAHYDKLIDAYGRFEQRKQLSATAKPHEPASIEAPGIMADLEADKLRIAQSLRDQLRMMLTAERRDRLDEEIGNLRRGSESEK